jgi:spermidine synthase
MRWPAVGVCWLLGEVGVYSSADFYCCWCLYAGVIQCTERDEFSYQEMIAHLPLCALEVRLLKHTLAA